MEKCLGILLFFVACTRCQNYYPDYPEPNTQSDKTSVEEFFLREFLDKVKPFINTIVEEWKLQSDMPGGFVEQLVEAYARRFPPPPSLSRNDMDSFLSHVEEFKTCIDETLARTADDPHLREKLSLFRRLGDSKNSREYLQQIATTDKPKEGPKME